MYVHSALTLLLIILGDCTWTHSETVIHKNICTPQIINEADVLLINQFVMTKPEDMYEYI